MPTTNFNLFQQVYLQTFAANLGGMFLGPESVLQSAVTKAVNALMTIWLKPYGWKVTWGPRVWKEKKEDIFSGLDNAWFVAFAPNVLFPDGVKIDTYVVAIAGTAVFSKHDWPVENFGVDTVVDFDSWIQKWQETPFPPPQAVTVEPPVTSPYSAYGTSDGTFRLMDNPAPSGTPGAGTTIRTYLQMQNLKNCRIIFTGHSLGGALSPTLALGLEGAGILNQIQPPQLNILTLPAAGATPGEQVFSTSYSNLFPLPTPGPEAYQTWNADFFNTLDIVPQAWCTNPNSSPQRNMQNILTIYGQLPSNLASKVSGLIAKEVAKANASGATYIPLQGNPFTGTAPKNPPSNLLFFAIEVIKQHTIAYYDQVKVRKVMAGLYRQFYSHEGVEKQNTAQAAQNYPVLRFIETTDLGVGFKNSYPYDVILED